MGNSRNRNPIARVVTHLRRQVVPDKRREADFDAACREMQEVCKTIRGYKPVPLPESQHWKMGNVDGRIIAISSDQPPHYINPDGSVEEIKFTKGAEDERNPSN